MENVFVIWSMVSFFIGFLIAALICTHSYKNSKYFNSSWDKDNDKSIEPAKLSPLEFEVRKVEGVYTKKGFKHIAKYTVHICYQTKKDDVNIEEYYFYADKGKYNVGDTLTLENLKTYDSNAETIKKACKYLKDRTGLYETDIYLFKKYLEK